MNDNNSHDKEIKRDIGLIDILDLLDLTEEELETYTEFLQNVYDDCRE